MDDIKSIFDDITNGINEEFEIIDTTEDDDDEVEIIDDDYLKESSNSDVDSTTSDIEELVEFEEFEVDVNLSGKTLEDLDTLNEVEAENISENEESEINAMDVEEKDFLFEEDDISDYKEYYDEDLEEESEEDFEEDSEEDSEEDFEEDSEDFEEESEDFEEDNFGEIDAEVEGKVEDLGDFNIFDDKRSLKSKTEIPKTEKPKEKTQNVENINEKLIKKTENEDKFKNCVYEKGMDIVDFLRSNPQYREKEYASHFFSQEVLKEAEKKGIINLKKGKYII